MSNIIETGEPIINLPQEVLERFNDRTKRGKMIERVFTKAYNYYYEHFEANYTDDTECIDYKQARRILDGSSDDRSLGITSDDRRLATRLAMNEILQFEDRLSIHRLIESLMFNAISQDNVRIINMTLQKEFHEQSIYLFRIMLDTISTILKQILEEQYKQARVTISSGTYPIPDLTEMLKGNEPSYTLLTLSELSTYYPKYDIKANDDLPHFYYDSGVVNFLVETINQEIKRMMMLNLTLEEDFELIEFKTTKNFYDVSISLEILDGFTHFYRETADKYIRGLIFDTLHEIAVKASVYLEVFNELTTANPDPALPFCIRLHQKEL